MIELKNVSKDLDDTRILDDISLTLKEGKIYGFTGRNGCGKSMLFKTICGFVTPTEGSVIINNEDIFKMNTFPKDLAALIERPKFLNNISGFDNLNILASINNKIGEEEINETLKQVDLEDEKNKKFGKYSLGMKQKLGIAQVLMEDPTIMVLDEPLSGLDNKSVDKIRKILLKKKNEGKLILIASHIKDDIKILCDEIFEMDAGTIIKHEIFKNKNKPSQI